MAESETSFLGTSADNGSLYQLDTFCYTLRFLPGSLEYWINKATSAIDDESVQTDRTLQQAVECGKWESSVYLATLPDPPGESWVYQATRPGPADAGKRSDQAPPSQPSTGEGLSLPTSPLGRADQQAGSWCGPYAGSQCEMGRRWWWPDQQPGNLPAIAETKIQVSKDVDITYRTIMGVGTWLSG